ncbi:electron transport complex subunit RsxC [Alteromonas sp. ZYF713]|nr:electron transport complex subunit RsxC [Alteromonas sp. ZYF713]
MPYDFEQIVERIDQQKFWTFPGGVHPQGRKHLSNQTAINTLPLPKQLVIPVKQHIGTAGACLVSVGDKVLKGQTLTSSPHPFSVPVHAPTSGLVTAIEERTTAHPSGLPELCVVIEADGNDAWTELKPIADYQQQTKSSLISAICEAGIAGMGGAGFPTHIKSTARKKVEFLIINGVECEPYITADDRLMREFAWQIRQGIDILSHLIEPKVVIIAIEDNKPEAFKAMQQVCNDTPAIRVVQIPTKYPAGGEKQLIQVLTGREVPRTGLPADIGVMMFNVGTCYAIADAILHGKPLIQRVVTVTGEAVQKPQNVWALIGTPIEHLLSQAQYQLKKQKAPTVIMGGPMMGFTLPSVEVPVVKITNCLLIPAKKELNLSQRELACIRCSACADACPVSLLPQQMYWHSKALELDKAEEYNLFDCIECGACAYVCPSEIPLVHYYRKAKAQIRIQRDDKDKAEKSKQRFEARKARLEKEKQEREAKHKKAAAARKQATQPATGEDGGAKDKVAAALARAKAKKAEQAQATESPAGAETKPDDNKAKVAAAIARAKAKKAQQTEAPVADSQGSAEDDRKAKVAAAVARAKAKKAAQQTEPDDTANATDSAPAESAEDARKAKVAAAVARAKAKKEAASGAPTESSAETGDDSDSREAQRKAKIAAAVAKAKAKKQAADEPEATEHEPAEPAQEEDSPEAQRKAKIAAAVAKAKAKKQAAEEAESEPQECDHEAAEPEQDEGSPEAQRKAKIAAAVARAKAKKAQREARQSGSEDNE